MSVKLRPGESFDSLLRRFKRETLKSEVLKELRQREYFVSKSEKRRKKAEEARRRAKREAAKTKSY